ncbi:hypothetical protein C7U57_06325 [Pseudomonas sp. R9.37]|nr:hypothetical protein C7U57_06325 [Pseudomonas sp. R9.37]
MIQGAPLTTLAARRLESVANPADAGLATLGRGWPSAAAHGFKPACGHTEPRRGAEWWGEDLLLTFGWAGIPVLPTVNRVRAQPIAAVTAEMDMNADQYPSQLTYRHRRQASSHF